MPLKTDYRLHAECFAPDCENRGACQLHVDGRGLGPYIPTLKVKHTEKGDHFLCVAYRPEGDDVSVLVRDATMKQNDDQQSGSTT